MTDPIVPHGAVTRTQLVDGQSIHYLEVGSGDPVVFLHGNPTSSFLWRNVLPHVAPHGRCIAPDLIGMGRSSKPEVPYRLPDHIASIDGFIAALGLSDITFVLHDWGVAIGMDYLRRHPDRVRGVAFMEGHLHPIERWDDYDEGARTMFRELRSDVEGRRQIVDENLFIEQVLPSGILRELSGEEMDAYREPFRDPRHREVIWRWVREIPVAGQPASVDAIVRAYRAVLAASDVPKLLLYAEPGAVVGADEVAWCRATLRNLTAVDLGPGLHFLPEDHPDAIGRAIAAWLGALGES